MDYWLSYTPGRLIQERPNLRSAYNVELPQLGHLLIGRVESYWPEGKPGCLRWRSLDHWYCDWLHNYTTREQAARELLTTCPRTIELVQSTQRRLELANGTGAG